MRVVVIGGGVSGLAAAFRLRELQPSLDLCVLESSGRVGGLLATEATADGFVIEHGPDSILTEKPAALALAERVGLANEVVRTQSRPRGAYIVARGRLEPVPVGFSLLAPTRAWPFLASPVISPRGKARALLDLALPRGPVRDDESLADFVTRRFGREVLERLAQPLAGGIYGADPALLSLRATMPRFLETEAAHRSVALGLRRQGRKAAPVKGARYGLFVSFRDGVEALPRALATALGDRVRTSVHVRTIERRSSGGFRVVARDGMTEEADAVILAIPAWAAAQVVGASLPTLAHELDGIPYGSSATVTFGIERRLITHPLDAFGFVVPEIEGRPIMAATWASEKWPGRAPSGMALIRVFVGGPKLDEVVKWSDERLIQVAREQLGQLMGMRGDPHLTRVDRYARAMPRYHVGHLARVDVIERTLAGVPGLLLAGNAFRGVGIPDAIASGERAAEAATALLQGPRG